MLNRDIYLYDPMARKLVNEGVANVNDELTEAGFAVLRYELETFVCEGQYQRGLEHILDTYLNNIDRPQQPGIWVSGFFGSGKSHLVKMLRALWLNTAFPDGATARGTARLPQDISDLLKRLDTEGKRHGGLHAASGTLGSDRGDISTRMIVLNIILKSAGLPADYRKAKLVMWLKKEGIYDRAKQLVEASGSVWNRELDSFFLSEELHKALVQLKPSVFSSIETCSEVLIHQYPNVQDISNDDMIKMIHDALSRDGKFPLTVIVLDEIQQFIGDSPQRSNEVQEVVEACCKSIGSKLLFVGTGQTAVTGTTNLKKLEGRFPVRIELSDSDVDTVIRKVVLQKKPESIPEIQSVVETNIGEISRHLAGTSFGHRREDMDFLYQDYPLLPVRRRFWESALRKLDPTGTETQLRNQLTTVFKAIKTNLDQPLGHIIPADFLYFEAAERLIQTRMLPRKFYDKISTWMERGTPEEKLMARACGIIFLINKLTDRDFGKDTKDNKNDKSSEPGAPPKKSDTGLLADPNTVADLLVEDLSAGSSELRSKLPRLLDECEILVNIDGKYRMKTEESTHWDNEFKNQQSLLSNEGSRLDTERINRVRKRIDESIKKVSTGRGDPKGKGGIVVNYEHQLPQDMSERICVWVRDEWMTDENSVRVDALKVGNQSPLIFVFIPKFSPDSLKHALLDFIASSNTLHVRGTPSTPDGIEARAYMETIRKTSEAKIEELLNASFSRAVVFNGGGTEVRAGSFFESIEQAARYSAERLFTSFRFADHPGWDKVFSKSMKGEPDALKAIGASGDINDNRVCNEIFGFIGAGKTGKDIRHHFQEPPYGWPQDPIDAGLMVLWLAGRIHAHDERGKNSDFAKFERKMIPQTVFKVEAAVLDVTQRMNIRRLMQRLEINAKSNEETSYMNDFLNRLTQLAESAGGEPPKPAAPDTSIIREARKSTGNEQILFILSHYDDVSLWIDRWKNIAERINTRWIQWSQLIELVYLSRDLEKSADIDSRAQFIKQRRLLIEEPDPVLPLLKELEDAVRSRLNESRANLLRETDFYMQRLESSDDWKKCTADERAHILEKSGISQVPSIDTADYSKLVSILKQFSFRWWQDTIDALPGRTDKAREMASKLMEPQTQTVDIPRRTLKTQQDTRLWLDEVEKSINSALAKGPVVIR